jgi:hypothetical protein
MVNSMVESSAEVSSKPEVSEESSNVIEVVSEGGAPDEYYDEYYNNGSYVYEGSYEGLGSSPETEESAPEEKPHRTKAAKRYATYAKVGMIIFGLISLGMIALLVYFNIKVMESKKAHPEWYPKKKEKKKEPKPKH